MSSPLHRLGCAALAVLALAVGGCGSGDSEGEKIPGATAQELLATIERIQSRVDAGVAGACDDIFENAAGGNFEETSQLVDSLPESTDPEIRSALSESLDRLQQLVSGECDEIQATEQEQVVPEDPDPEETVPEETETTPTETETAPSTETTPVTPPPPTDDGTGQDDGGQGNGLGPDGTGPPGQSDGDGGGFEAPDGGDG